MNDTSFGWSPVCIDFNGFSFYVENMKLSLAKNIAEEGSLDGNLVYTAQNVKSSRITFSGRIHSSEAEDFILDTDSLIHSSQLLNIIYKTLYFTDCRLFSCVVEDAQNDYISVKLILLTPNPAEEAVNNAQTNAN